MLLPHAPNQEAREIRATAQRGADDADVLADILLAQGKKQAADMIRGFAAKFREIERKLPK